MIASTLAKASCHNAIYSVMVHRHNATYSVVRNAAERYNRDMNTRLKLESRAKIIEAIRALPTDAARRAWVDKLAGVLHDMQK